MAAAPAVSMARATKAARTIKIRRPRRRGGSGTESSWGSTTVPAVKTPSTGVEPGLEDHAGGHRVDVTTPVGRLPTSADHRLAGHHRGVALVPGLDRHRERAGQGVYLLLGGGGGGARLAGHGDRHTHYHSFRLHLGDDIGDGPVIASRVAAALDHRVGRSQDARAVADGDADAAAAEIDPKHPHRWPQLFARCRSLTTP